ncbi:hypothetical protein PPL_06523 [Heterostelium album PN500]|uniref:AIG1-type G domain-containing protein n=1 Tax=Heterostelium pallidum (strain ATCC 26659 / Pp 5 / PN500) TaxID=670386 RepID=D3BDE0_HETP5|nr:hypothetical protein PPL_06523 [Heterostelium album PN500]EFA80584.1 hypothetical protein PPL_06523 [Heterostelium album PN500]|eukprot:XP_020432704.1 hypothetical protein PPL_06523 [Heterostelium album PN500]
MKILIHHLIFISFILSVISASTQSDKNILVLVGETGSTKSSTGNFLISDDRFKVGYFIKFQTKTTQLECPSSQSIPCILDTPGLLDTDGFTDNEILELIKSKLLVEAPNNRVKIALVLNGQYIRLRISTLLSSIMSIFGPKVLDSMIFLVNSCDSLEKNGISKENFTDCIVSNIGHLYQNQKTLVDRIVYYDSHNSLEKYLQSILQSLESVSPISIDGLNELEIEAQSCLLKEIDNPSNWKVWTENHPLIVSKTVDKTVTIKVPYTQECNCRKICRKKIFGKCIRRKICETCVYLRDETKTVEDIVYETHNNYIEKKERLNTDEYLLQRCKSDISNRIESIVLEAVLNRNFIKS